MANPNTGQKQQSGFGQAASEMKSKTQEAASSVTDKAKEMASSAARSVGDTASNLGHKASETATNVRHKTDDAVGSVGTGMKNLAGTVREKAPHEGIMGAASSGVANALERGGRYIEQEKLSGMAEDFVAVLKENPLLTIGIGIGLGFLIAQLIPSSRRSY
jgi:ElaB/YqjD/DUF883 family membrane-anchored ribosome-binding protein